jgi:hypothetical protein
MFAPNFIAALSRAADAIFGTTGAAPSPERNAAAGRAPQPPREAAR